MKQKTVDFHENIENVQKTILIQSFLIQVILSVVFRFLEDKLGKKNKKIFLKFAQ